MKTDQKEAAEFWRGVLSRSGYTAIPRWTLEPKTGIGTTDVELDKALASEVLRLRDELSVSTNAIYLAAHAKVLGALSGESDLTTGFVPPKGSEPLPCTVSVDSDSWHDLIGGCEVAVVGIAKHHDFPVQELSSELGSPELSFETVLAIGNEVPLDDPTILSVTVLNGQSSPTLRLTYQTASLDVAAVERIGGYYVRALEHMSTDPRAAHDDQSLLSSDELGIHLEELAGPVRDLPDYRFHQLFEQRVLQQPDAVAAICGHEQWSYSELNSRANKIARALRARGARRETIVSVITERNLDWMATVLAILKVGAVYLPIEPHFPADRIANMLSRANCRLLVTERGSTKTLYEAMAGLPTVHGFFAKDAYREDRADHDLDTDVGTGQLAYIYFTSGSTGQPKGAMCEQLGMLNHLYAKIDDFGITEGQSVAQIAPQCFDISLWQLVSALLVGGTTVLIDQDTLLDPKRFTDEVRNRDVAVLQVVPSYLEVLLTYLENNTVDLGSLHCVSVTGEALTLELAKRWFACQPDIKLANAYGLTETCDDTNHEVMTEAPAGDRVPLGPAVNNVDVRVVDETLTPVPLGAPGEIVFGGVCVGRGYINDPERTEAVFVDDPMFDGRRLYRSGDFGRWSPEGKLEFLGRRDAQVKIRGFRIEIGDIENALLEIDGVRNGAVVITSSDDGNKQLIAFYTGDGSESAEVLSELRAALPDYMVPSFAHQQDALPLSSNGKIDRKILRALAAELQVIDLRYETPETPNEKLLAATWGEILSIAPDDIGRLDNFFDRGASSLSAVKLVIALNRRVSLKDVTQMPVLADLAALLDGDSKRESSLLQLLSDEPESSAGALICFPYAGGNAINFRALAETLRGRGPSVYAIDLPGHDVAAEREDFVPLPNVVDRIVDEIVDRDLGNVLLWGQSSGTALELETALRLEAGGVAVQRVFLGAQLLGSVEERSAHTLLLDSQTNAQIAERLAEDSGYVELGQLKHEQAEQVGAAYRHDCTEAHHYFIGQIQNPPTERIHAPVTVVTAADDPTLTESNRHFSDWQLFADQVELEELGKGGHYFVRTQLEDTADVILRSLSSTTSRN